MEKSAQFRSYDLDKKIRIIIRGLIECKFQIDPVVLNLQTQDGIVFLTLPVSFYYSMPARFFFKQSGFGFPLFKAIRVVIKYHPSLKSLAMPVFMRRTIQIMLTWAQKYSANIALFTLKCLDINFELEMETNGEIWSLDTLESMDKSMKNEYDQLDINAARKAKWFMRPVALAVAAHQMNGTCGVRNVANGKNESLINKAIYFQWPVHKFNPRFDWDRWKKRNRRKKPLTKEIAMELDSCFDRIEIEKVLSFFET